MRALTGRLAVPLALTLVALLVRAVAAALLPVAPTEGAAWYAGVAAAIAEGRGLVADATWSYATAPLVLPKPAFELWQPLASFVSVPAMLLAGPAWGVAQAMGVLIGALVAPLTWAVAREAAAQAGLDARRAGAVALASGLLVALSAPLVLAAAAPESTNVFLVAALAVALLTPRALAGGPVTPGLRGRLPGVALGLALGVAWLARQEAIWLGAAVLVAALRVPGRPAGVARWGRVLIGRLAPVVIGGLVIVVPWLLRQRAVFGTPFPGQATENLWLKTNEEVFAWAERPEAAAYLARGIGALVDDRVGASLHQLIGVLLVPAFPIGLAGLLALAGLRRTPALRMVSAWTTLLLAGALTFLATALLFPVATRWGTFLHASGPLLVALSVAAALGGDALVARISRARRWERENIVIAPVALIAVTAALLGLQLAVEAARTGRLADRLAVMARDLDTRGVEPVLIADQPVRIGEAAGRMTVVLPDEPPEAVLDLARFYGTRTIVLLGERGRYPAAFLDGPGRACLAAEPERIGPADAPAWLLRLAESC